MKNEKLIYNIKQLSELLNLTPRKTRTLLDQLEIPYQGKRKRIYFLSDIRSKYPSFYQSIHNTNVDTAVIDLQDVQLEALAAQVISLNRQ